MSVADHLGLEYLVLKLSLGGYKCSKSCSAKKKKLSRTLTLTKIFPVHNPHHARVTTPK